MPIFRMSENMIFPPVRMADESGLLAFGGNLNVDSLLSAYSSGIFPWFSDDQPILWWSPDPRLVLYFKNFRVSKSLNKLIKKEIFHVTMDTAFKEVIYECASLDYRKDDGTWIVPQMIDAYCRLHQVGYAHSVEAWHDGQLVGGLYGVSLGKSFFGESMFTRKSNASKVAFVYLVRFLEKEGFDFIDCQVSTEHLISFGACEVERSLFLKQLDKSLKTPSKKGRWFL